MLDHVSIGTPDLPRATTFYRTLLDVLGYRLHRDDGAETVFGPPDVWAFFLYPVDAGTQIVGARMHIALRAEDRATALAFERTALALGARQLREVAERPQFGADYFGGVFIDLDGHAIEVLTRAP
jgi:catechol 2,3-dioxygenase-like lactoylglutathione lyase family enzyme